MPRKAMPAWLCGIFRGSRQWNARGAREGALGENPDEGTQGKLRRKRPNEREHGRRTGSVMQDRRSMAIVTSPQFIAVTQACGALRASDVITNAENAKAAQQTFDTATRRFGSSGAKTGQTIHRIVNRPQAAASTSRCSRASRSARYPPPQPDTMPARACFQSPRSATSRPTAPSRRTVHSPY